MTRVIILLSKGEDEGPASRKAVLETKLLPHLPKRVKDATLIPIGKGASLHSYPQKLTILLTKRDDNFLLW
jgi:hypothetical protein